MKIVIAAEIDFPPEQRTAALAGAKDLIDQALSEPGCRYYTWTADFFHPGRVHVFEEWDCEQDLAAHFAGTPYKNIADHLNAHSILNVKARKYRVDLTEDVYTPDGVPSASFDCTSR